MDDQFPIDSVMINLNYGFYAHLMHLASQDRGDDYSSKKEQKGPISDF